MKVENENIVITDPCYVLTEEDYDTYTDCYENSFIKHLGFNEFIIDDTGIGDWSNSVYMNDEKIGDFGADSGMVFVCTEKDLLDYAPDREKMKEYIEKCERNLAVVPNFTGEITLERKDDLAVIRGINNDKVIFHTEEFEDDEEE